MKRFLVSIANEDGSTELHPMKEWLRGNPDAAPGVDPRSLNSHRVCAELRMRDWRLEARGDEIILTAPAVGARPRTVRARAPADAAPTDAGERSWVRGLVPMLQRQLRHRDPSLDIIDGFKLAYAREVRWYGDDDVGDSGMVYETDLLVIERRDDRWTPRVVVEAKLRTVTTHDAITYSQKAATHKQVHPYLRYGIFLGNRRDFPLPGRLFRHGAHFDFMLSWVGLVPTRAESSTFVDVLAEEVEASRTLEEVIFNSRSSSRARYTILRKPLVVG